MSQSWTLLRLLLKFGLCAEKLLSRHASLGLSLSQRQVSPYTKTSRDQSTVRIPIPEVEGRTRVRSPWRVASYTVVWLVHSLVAVSRQHTHRRRSKGSNETFDRLVRDPFTIASGSTQRVDSGNDSRVSVPHHHHSPVCPSVMAIHHLET